MEVNAKNSAASPDNSQTSKNVNELSVSKMLMQVGIIIFVANILGFMFGLLLGAIIGGSVSDLGDTIEKVAPLFLLVHPIIMIPMLTFCALSVRKNVKWKHLFIVATGVSLVSCIINLTVFQMMSMELPPIFLTFVFALFLNYLCMGVGGFIANFFRNSV
jgi:putative Mn2+ efflux pump MntP